MKTKLFIFLLFIGAISVGFGQKNAVKLGVFQTSTNFIPTLEYEREFLIPYLSIAPKAGFSWFDIRSGTEGYRFKKFHLSGQVRYYFLLRKRESLEGFYTCVNGFYNSEIYFQQPTDRKEVVWTRSKAGPGLGFQYDIYKGIILDLNTTLNYGTWRIRRENPNFPDGYSFEKFWGPTFVFSYSLGYKF